MPTSEAQKKAVRKYNDANQRQIKFAFSLKYDTDILAQLDAVPNKQGYIKDLIRADIAAQNKEEKKMKRSEAIEAYRAKIEALMIEKYRTVIGCDGRIQYGIYVWSDGDVQYLEDVQGSNSYLKANDGETRDLFYVTTVDAPGFDLWAADYDGAPEDDAEREKKEQELIDWYVDEYRQTVPDILDAIIEDAQQQEDEP